MTSMPLATLSDQTRKKTEHGTKQKKERLISNRVNTCLLFYFYFRTWTSLVARQEVYPVCKRTTPAASSCPQVYLFGPLQVQPEVITEKKAK